MDWEYQGSFLPFAIPRLCPVNLLFVVRAFWCALFDYLEAGHTLERFLNGFPTVSREMVLQASEEAKESLFASH